ncbi:MAG TPA: tetratricopeptide repeat protein [Puia sp.]|jgi:tetratricopeptide (TPR) repeat protein|nr:tetratricopeptide repeat protein [Puia sp.]
MDRIGKLKEFLSIDPDDPFIKHALALEYQKLGEFQTARSLWEELLQKDPGAVGSYYHLGKLLESLGERQLAIEWYEKGMAAAAASGERRALNELRAAYDDLADE